jgi:hypothetical protein
VAGKIPGTSSRRLGERVHAEAHRHATHCSTEQEPVQRFASEITELRALGFAEGLPIEAIDRPCGIVIRLESGRIGVEVEFCAGEGTPLYAVKPLVRDIANGSDTATDIWSDIVRDIRRRAPLSDDE